MGCGESKPRDCLLSPASKAYLTSFSGVRFCGETLCLHRDRRPAAGTGGVTACLENSPACFLWLSTPPTLPSAGHQPLTPRGNTDGLGSLCNGASKRQDGAKQAACKDGIKEQVRLWGSRSPPGTEGSISAQGDPVVP